MGVGAQIACVPRRFALIMVVRGWLASPGLGSFGVMLGSFGAVRQTPLFRWGPSSLSYRRLCPGGVLRRRPHLAPPRGDCFPRVSGVTGARLGTQRGNRVETVLGGTRKPNGNHVETSWKPRGNHMDLYMW